MFNPKNIIKSARKKNSEANLSIRNECVENWFEARYFPILNTNYFSHSTLNDYNSLVGRVYIKDGKLFGDFFYGNSRKNVPERIIAQISFEDIKFEDGSISINKLSESHVRIDFELPTFIMHDFIAEPISFFEYMLGEFGNAYVEKMNMN